MPGTRSRQGCEECRRRRRKCDEQKPACGQCTTFNRSCNYSLRLVWGVHGARKSFHGQGGRIPKQYVTTFNAGPASPTTVVQRRLPPPAARPADVKGAAATIGLDTIDDIQGPPATGAYELVQVPRSLPNGLSLPPQYHKLLTYFTDNVLASLSCHPSIHQDLCRGLVPATFQSPQLLSACLALSAAGFTSRGLSHVEGVQVRRILGHLQSSGLPLLRSALDNGKLDDTLLATCLIWCLADVFTYRQGESSWRIHLQGIKAILDSNQAHQHFLGGTGPARSAMRHLYLLYLSLQTLPFIPPSRNAATEASDSDALSTPARGHAELTSLSPTGPKIDGFLGYSEELLHILQRIDELSTSATLTAETTRAEADILLGKVKGMIRRDAEVSPGVAIGASLSPEYGREFLLCHKTFQQATLIHLYRRLYHLPSRSYPIQLAIRAINDMVTYMAQGQPCHTWVAMAMPLFTIGCEVYTEDQKKFVVDKIDKLEECIGSLHVKIIRQALEDIWRVRLEKGDSEGDLCATQLLEELRYNIILF